VAEKRIKVNGDKCKTKKLTSSCVGGKMGGGGGKRNPWWKKVLGGGTILGRESSGDMIGKERSQGRTGVGKKKKETHGACLQ